LPEVKARLAQQGAQVSVAALWRFCRRHKLTRKKKTAHASEQDRPDVLSCSSWHLIGQLASGDWSVSPVCEVRRHCFNLSNR
jgi:hypothetical protein